MRNFSLLSLALFLAACGHTPSGPVEPTATVPDFAVFYSEEYNLVIEYPTGWVPQEGTFGFNNQAFAFLTPFTDSEDSFNDNVNLLIQDLALAPIEKPVSLEAYVELSKSQLETAGAQVLGEETEATLLGLPAQEIAYKTVMQDRDMQFWQRWAVSADGNFAYVLTYTALPETYDDYLEQAKQMAEAARFGG